MRALSIDVLLLPSMLQSTEMRVCVIIDVIRGSSAIVELFSKGSREIVLGPCPDEVASDVQSPIKICAENAAGLVAEDADFSPSLIAIGEANVSGHRVFLTTTNGTVAIQEAVSRGAADVLIGSLMNGASVAQRAVVAAKRLDTGVAFVCAGRGGGTIFAIDDMYCAGRLVRHAISASEREGLQAELTDAAKAACDLSTAYPGPLQAFAVSASAAVLRRAGNEPDIALCAREDIVSVVPRAVSSRFGEIRLVNPNGNE